MGRIGVSIVLFSSYMSIWQSDFRMLAIYTKLRVKSLVEKLPSGFVFDNFSWIKWCPGADLNHRHEDFQSTALPLSYPGTEKHYALGSIVLGRHASTIQRDFG